MNTIVKAYSQEQCYSCNTEGKYLYKNLTDQIFNSPGVWNLKQCQNTDCGLCWLDPMPFPDEIYKFYDNYHTHNQWNDDNQGNDNRKPGNGPTHQSVYKPLKSSIKYLLSLVSSTNKQPITSTKTNVLVESPKPGQKLLDVGCGNGNNMNQKMKQGWQVVGTDFDEKAVETAKKEGLEVYLGDLSEIKFEDNSFDVITMNHVIEHLHNPLETLKECYRILRDKGQILIVTPNMRSLGHHYFEQHWRGLETPRHLFLFSPQNLEAILYKAGFTEINYHTGPIKITFKPSLIVKESIGIRNSNLGSQMPAGFQNFLDEYEARLLVIRYNLLNLLGNKTIGECISLSAKKVV